LKRPDNQGIEKHLVKIEMCGVSGSAQAGDS